MGMSEFYGATDDAQSRETMARAPELGVNFFDSADIYGFGHNETLIDQFLKAGGPARREQVVRHAAQGQRGAPDCRRTK